MLYQGDKFVCPRCGGGGEIEIVYDIATAYKSSRIVLDEKIKINPYLLQQIIDHVSAAAIYSGNNYQRNQEFRPRFRTMRRLHDLHMKLFEDQEARELFKIYGDKSWN